MSKTREFKLQFLKERLDKDRSLFDICLISLCKSECTDVENLDMCVFLNRRIRESLEILQCLMDEDGDE